MASIYEIHDPTQLRYEMNLGLRVDDSGFGPPSEVPGWIRTGGVGYTKSAAPGTSSYAANCLGYTSSEMADYGTAALLYGMQGSSNEYLGRLL